MSWNMSLLKNLASLRLTVGLLLWIAFLCILGTIDPQQPLPSAAGVPFAMHVISLLSLRDVFHSLWFLIPAAALCVNALACMYLWRKAFGGSTSMPKALLYEITIPGEGAQDRISADLTSFMKGTHRHLPSREGHTELIMGEKGMPRKFAPFLVHGSILLILLGAGLGFLGYKGSLEVPVGQASDTVTLSNGKIMHLPFQVRCDDFKMELYDNGMPKEYRSEISFLQGDRVARHASLLVNHPVSFSRVLFSQSGYNTNTVAIIKVSTPAGNDQINAAEGSVIELHDTGYKVHVLKVVQDIMHMGPGVQLVIETPKGEQEVWVFKQIEQILAMHPGIIEKMPQFNPSQVKPYTFSPQGRHPQLYDHTRHQLRPGHHLCGSGMCSSWQASALPSWLSMRGSGYPLEKLPQGLTIKVAQRSNGKPTAVSQLLLEHLDSIAGVKS